MQSVDVKTGAGTGVLPAPSDQDEVDLVPVRTYWTLVRQRFVRHQLAVIGAITLALIVIVRDRHPAVDRRRLPEVVAPADQCRPVALGAAGL